MGKIVVVTIKVIAWMLIWYNIETKTAVHPRKPRTKIARLKPQHKFAFFIFDFFILEECIDNYLHPFNITSCKLFFEFQKLPLSGNWLFVRKRVLGNCRLIFALPFSFVRWVKTAFYACWDRLKKEVLETGWIHRFRSSSCKNQKDEWTIKNDCVNRQKLLSQWDDIKKCIKALMKWNYNGWCKKSCTFRSIFVWSLPILETFSTLFIRFWHL